MMPFPWATVSNSPFRAGINRIDCIAAPCRGWVAAAGGDAERADGAFVQAVSNHHDELEEVATLRCHPGRAGRMTAPPWTAGAKTELPSGGSVVSRDGACHRRRANPRCSEVAGRPPFLQRLFHPG